jgi:uncharacterized membrane protein
LLAVGVPSATVKEREDWRHRARRRLASVARESAAALTGWGVVAFAIAISPGFAAWGLQVDDPAEHFLDNELSTRSLFGVLDVLVSSALAVGVIYALVALRSIREGGFDRGAMVALNRRLAFLLAIPFGLPFVFVGFEAEHPFVTLLFAGAAAAAVAVSVAAWWPERRMRLDERWAAVLVGGMATLWVWKIARLQTIQHQALQTNTYDLGIYLNLMWRSLHGDFLASSFLRGGSHVSAHFDPILVPLSPVLLIHEGAEALFVLQATWVASAVFPIFLLAKRHASAAFGVVLAFVYLMHPAVQGMTLFDFHSLTLSVPFVVWAVYFLEGRRWLAYALVIAGWLACREDMAIATAFLGIYAIAAHGEVRAGVVTVVVSGLYLAYVKGFVMPDSDLLMLQTDDAYGYRKYFRGLDPRDAGLIGVLGTLVSNPTQVGAHLMDEPRVLFALQLLLPLAFVPLLAGRRWILLGYGLAFTLLASRTQVYTVGFHYAASLVPALFALTPALARAHLPRLRMKEGRAWVFLGTFMVVAATLSTAAFGAFAENERFVPGGRPMLHELDAEAAATYRWVRNYTDALPPDARVTASGALFPHVALRRAVYPMPDFDRAEWVLTRKAGRGTRPHAGLRRLEASPKLEKVAEHDGIVIYRRLRW